jgi:hypothetical protein
MPSVEKGFSDDEVTEEVAVDYKIQTGTRRGLMLVPRWCKAVEVD